MRLNISLHAGLSLIIMQLFVLSAQRFSRAIQAKGNRYAVIMVSSARTSTHNPLRSQENVTLWCQVCSYLLQFYTQIYNYF